MEHFRFVGGLNIDAAIGVLEKNAAHFADETWRQDYPGTAHGDTETIYLRMPPRLSVETLFDSMEVVDCPLAGEFSPLLNDVCGVVESGALARAMLIKLKPGGKITPHIDEGAYAEATDRYHLPLVTNRQAWLKSGGEVLRMEVGELWWFDKHALHEGRNEGDSDRVHLVADFFRGK